MPMGHDHIRVKQLNDNIRSDMVLLGEYEDKLQVTSDPKERKFCKQEIERLKKSITAYQAELAGITGTTPPPIGSPTPTPTPNPGFSYVVQVTAIDGHAIPGAKVTISAPDIAPIITTTDFEGIARIFIPSSHAGRAGELRVEADGFDEYWRNIDLYKGVLPQSVQLIPERATEPPTPTPKKHRLLQLRQPHRHQ